LVFSPILPDIAGPILEEVGDAVMKIGIENQSAINEMRKAAHHTNPQAAIACS
jgi:hypothetical protein